VTLRSYASPAAFKQALEQRLRDSSMSGKDFARRRQRLVFERFLARIESLLGEAVVLKGGLALELRIDRARTTKDIDLRVVGSPDGILERLQQAGQIALGEFMTFEVQPDPQHPTIRNEAMKYDGLRYRVTCRLAGKIYGESFGVDVAFADPILGKPDVLTAPDILGFVDIAPPTLHVYPIETHVAEKLHAYTMPRERENSRVRDLPDLALLATIREIESPRLVRAIAQTFSHRGTHATPSAMPDPPMSWAEVYREMAAGDALAWASLDEVLRAARGFIDPVLDGRAGARWSPSAWEWTP
jgi:hypothetical protein